MSPLGLGSDVAISVRGPAHDTGIVALKATRGRIPITGHWPQVDLAGLRVGWACEPAFGPVDREVVATVTTAAEALRELECVGEAAPRPDAATNLRARNRCH
jgi:hypothetical protein